MARSRPHRPADRRPASRGMTLIEISIALVIVALMVFVAVPSIEAYAGVRAREEAGRIAGAVRYLYDKSALSGHVCRIVFDMDERSWYPECTEGRFTVERDKERSRDGRRIEDPKADKPRRYDPRDEVDQLRQKVEKKAEFAEFKDEELHRRTLPDGANVAVWTGHQRERYTKGKAFLYFFPQGNTERAQIYVTSDHGDAYTLVVSPLNGRVQVENQEVAVPRD